MTQQPLANASLWWNRALTLALILPGLVVAANLDAGTGLGESAHSVVLGLAPMVVPAAGIALVVWVLAPGAPRLSRAGRAKVGRTVRSGAAIDDAGLASAVVKRADATVQRLEHQLENRNRRRVGGALFM